MNIDFLIEMGWKSALISAAALAFAALLRSRSADERAAVLRSAVALILMLPLLALLLPALPVVAWAAPDAAPLPAYIPLADAAASSIPAAPAIEPAVRDDPTALILIAWLGGVAMIGFRLAAGLWTLNRWTRAAAPVECPAWRQAFEAAAASTGPARRVRLLVADVPSPLGWGWLNPVILIDRDTIRQPDEAEAVLAHELAHVERRDWLVLILARVAVALFWFNPLMWLLERHMVEEAEQAADARALARVEPARYAQTLLSCARSYPGLPATGIADTGLARRVKAVLEGRVAGAGSPRRARFAMLLCLAIAAPVAALKPVAAAPEAPESLPAPPAPLAPLAAPNPASMAVPAAPLAPGAVPVPPAPLAALAPLAPPSPAAPFSGLAPAAPMPPRPLAMMRAPVPPAPPMPRARGEDEDDGDEVDFDLDTEDGAEIGRDLEETLADAAEAIAEVTRQSARISAHARAEAAEAVRNSARISAQARESARRGIAAGAVGMANGARGMENGARGMEAEADRLRSPRYRARKIAEAARRGESVTDAELVALIPKLRHGAEGLRRGAENMRRSAERMRRDGR
jgi:beta-lactamase regulating signal transducer with metallopeptidase domain